MKNSDLVLSDHLQRMLLFISNGVTPEASLEEFRRTPLFNVQLILGVLFLGVFGTAALLMEHILFGAAELSAAGLLLVLYFTTRKKGIPIWASTFVLVLFYFAFLILAVTGGPDGNGFLWMYAFPAAAVFFAGPRIGSLWALSLLAAAAGITAQWGGTSHIVSYDSSLFFRICGSYILLVIFTAATDVVLIYSFIKMKEMQGRLEETIDELNKSREELHQQAIHDGLTGVYNRRFFNQTITTWTIQAQRHQSDTALFMIDVDFFKKYNDRFGHLKGDSILKSVAGTIQGVLRRESDMVFRYGGEEFTVLLTKTTPETTRKIAESILHSIRRCNIPHPDSKTGTLSVSIGIAEWNPIAEQVFPEDLIEIADSALYEAKAAGRACIVCRSCDLSADTNRKTSSIPVAM